jgi:hypothetical protein
MRCGDKLSGHLGYLGGDTLGRRLSGNLGNARGLHGLHGQGEEPVKMLANKMSVLQSLVVQCSMFLPPHLPLPQTPNCRPRFLSLSFLRWLRLGGIILQHMPLHNLLWLLWWGQSQVNIFLGSTPCLCLYPA